MKPTMAWPGSMPMPMRSVGPILGYAEQGHDRITNELVHHAAVALDGPRRLGEPVVEQVDQLHRSIAQLLGQTGVIAQVAEEHSQLLQMGLRCHQLAIED